MEKKKYYVWCEHCGYNRRTDETQDKLLTGAKETWCPECEEGILGHGSEWPDHMHMDWPQQKYDPNE